MSARLCALPECGRPVYFGLYCSNLCSDAGFAQWRERRAEAEAVEAADPDPLVEVRRGVWVRQSSLIEGARS